MTSYYLSAECQQQRIDAMKRRIAGEAKVTKAGELLWPRDSDYWKLPRKLQRELSVFAFSLVFDS